MNLQVSWEARGVGSWSRNGSWSAGEPLLWSPDQHHRFDEQQGVHKGNQKERRQSHERPTKLPTLATARD